MPVDDAAMKQMDEAAEQARIELDSNIDHLTARDVAAWWVKWYMKAGHKRLGRILVGLGRKKKGDPDESA